MPMQVVESSYDPEADAATIYFVREALERIGAEQGRPAAPVCQ
jgi:hypothetical protein